MTGLTSGEQMEAYSEAVKSGLYAKRTGLVGKYDNVRRYWEDEITKIYLRPHLHLKGLFPIAHLRRGRGAGHGDVQAGHAGVLGQRLVHGPVVVGVEADGAGLAHGDEGLQRGLDGALDLYFEGVGHDGLPFSFRKTRRAFSGQQSAISDELLLWERHLSCHSSCPP